MLNLPKKTLILIAALLSFLVAVGFLLFSQPQKEEPQKEGVIPTLVPEQARGFKKPSPPLFRPIPAPSTQGSYSVAFQLPPSFSLPSAASVVRVTHAIQPRETSGFAAILGLSDTPQTYKDSLLWALDSQSLLVNTVSGFVQYQNSSPLTDADRNASKISSDEAQKIAEDSLKKLNTTNINKNAATIKRYKDFSNGEIEETTNQQETYLYEFAYTQSFQGIPIFLQLGAPSKIVAWVDTLGNTRKLEFFNLLLEATHQERIKSLDEIKKEMEAGKATVVKIGEQADFPTQIRNLIVSDIELTYFDDKTTPYLYPVFVITGTSTTDLGIQQITLYLSAI